MPKFKTAKGDLTQYALACGYMQSINNDWNISDETKRRFSCFISDSMGTSIDVFLHDHDNCVQLMVRHYDKSEAGYLDRARKCYRECVRFLQMLEDGK